MDRDCDVNSSMTLAMAVLDFSRLRRSCKCVSTVGWLQRHPRVWPLVDIIFVGGSAMIVQRLVD